MPFPSAVSPQFTDNVGAIQLINQRRQRAVRQLYSRSPLLHLLMKAGDLLNVRGPSLEVPVSVADPITGSWISYYDKLPDAVDIDLRMGFVENRYLVVPMGHNILKVWENQNNPTAILDILRLMSFQAAWGEKATLGEGVWNGNGGKEPNGLTTQIEAAAPSAQTAVVTGIPKTTQSWARNPVVQLTKNFGYVGPRSRTCAGRLAFDQLVNQCTFGTVRPSHALMHRDVWHTFERYALESLDPRRATGSRESHSMGIESLDINGVELMADDKSPNDRIYTVHIGENVQKATVNGDDQGYKYDHDLESAGKDSFIELRSSLALIRHPDIINRPINARSAPRSLQQTSWLMTSCNLGSTRPNQNGVGYSDNGQRWRTF